MIRRRIRYPVTLILGLQYSALVIFPAIINRNPNLSTFAPIVIVGLATSFVTESLFLKRRPSSSTKASRYPRPLAAWAVTLIGGLAVVIDTSLGGSTYSTLIGVTAASPLTTLVTPLVSWLLIGCAFGLASWWAGLMSRRDTLFLLTVAVAVMLITVLRTAQISGLVNFWLAVGAGMVLVGFLRPRWLWVGLAVAVLSWPTLYALRNESRGAVSTVVSPTDASSRLREDLLMQRVGRYQIVQASPLDVITTGLIPHLIDPGRGNFPNTGPLVSVLMGGPSDSYDTFTLLGDLWSFNGGYVAVVFYVGVAAAAFALLYRRITPMRVAFAMLFVAKLLYIESVYPDGIAALLQTFESLLVAMGLAILLGLRVSGQSGQILPPAASRTAEMASS